MATDLKQAFQSIRRAYTRSDVLSLVVRDDDGNALGEINLLLECSPNRRVSEFLELRDKGLISSRKFQEVIFAESVVKIGEIDVRNVESIPVGDDAEMRQAFKDATAVTPKEYLQWQAETAMSDFVLDNVEAVYSHLMAEISRAREKDVRNAYVENVRANIEAANKVKKEVKAAPVPETAGEKIGPEPIPGVNVPPPAAMEAMRARAEAEAAARMVSSVESQAAPDNRPLPDEPTKF